ncbi:MAG: 23S rRNA (uracil(1939)-C(5))-methyltransferase RlmD [Chitinophagales bacterium]|nr:23S rRNA (uracil(1939)-C(5))-methyltransferase RlmD [Chitinophagales bacterium]
MAHRKNKHKIYEHLLIESMSSEGLGIARKNEKVVFVENTIPGDVVKAKTFQKRKSYEKCHLLEIEERSENRIEPFCTHFASCGGCKWQYLPYKKQLEYKEKTVTDAFTRLAKVKIEERLPILAAPFQTYYRNKLEYTFSNNRWLTTEEIQSGKDFEKNALGFHVPGNFSKVVDIETCYLQNDFSNLLKNSIRKYALENDLSFYDIREQQGFLRNLVIRTADTGQILVLLIVGKGKDALFPLLDFVYESYPQITSLQYIINTKRNDSYFDLEPVCYKGEAFIVEELDKFQFKIRAKSFFQTNTKQGKRLYDVVKDFAYLQGTETLYDLYSGVGSIGIYLSDACKKLVGIEQIDQAVEDAKENARLNKLNNASFYVGDVRMLLNEEFLQNNDKPDVLITDPPRAGMHPDVVETLLKAEVPRLVYVSCNPATQARDIALLSTKYNTKRLQAVDMFPQTVHIESVALLELR